MNINDFRIVELSRHGELKDDWRQSLTRILTLESKRNTGSVSNFFHGKEDLNACPEVQLLMTTPVHIKTNNKSADALNTIGTTVDSLLGGVGTKLSNVTKGFQQIGKLAATIDGTITGGEEGTGSAWYPWFQNIKSWDGVTGGVTFDYTFKFSMGQYGLWNAFEEVFKPVLNLIALAMPRSIGNFTTSGPYPTAIDMVAKVFSHITEKETTQSTASDGTTSTSTYRKVKSALKVDAFSEMLSGILNDAYTPFTYDISFGRQVTFYKMLVINGEYSFSTETDQYGYPIEGSVTLSFEGAVPIGLTAQNGATGIRFGNWEDKTK